MAELRNRLASAAPIVERAKAEKQAAEEAKSAALKSLEELTERNKSLLQSHGEALQRASTAEANVLALKHNAVEDGQRLVEANDHIRTLQSCVNDLTPGVEKAIAEREAAEAARQDATKRLHELGQKYAVLEAAQREDIERAATAEQKVEGIHAHNANMHRTIELLTQERNELHLQLSDALAKQQADQAAAHQFENVGQRVLKETLEEAARGMEALASTYQKISGAELEKHTEKMALTLEPLQNKLKEYDAAVDALKLNTQEIYGGLKAQMADLQSAERALHDQARALTTALSAGPKVRGTYGEIVLKQLVEFVGMQTHCHFETQVSRETEEGRRIPDMVVHLPGGQKVIVDSKAVMSACTEAYQATDENQRSMLLKKHCDNVRARVVDLSAKSYFENHADAVEAVVLFLPAENLYAAAMENDPELTEFAMRRDIILCGPNSLIMLLKVSNQIWRRAAIEQEAQQIAQYGNEIYKYACDFLGKYARIGNRIKQLESDYNDALGTLDGRLIPAGRRMSRFEAVANNRTVEDMAPLGSDIHDYRSMEGKRSLQELVQPGLALADDFDGGFVLATPKESTVQK